MRGKIGVQSALSPPPFSLLLEGEGGEAEEPGEGGEAEEPGEGGEAEEPGEGGERGEPAEVEDTGEPGEDRGKGKPGTAGAGGREKAAVRAGGRQREVGARASGERGSWAAIAVAVIIVVAGTATYLQLNPPVQLTARGWHPATATAGENVPFYANNSSASGSALVKYAWNFGDGSTLAGKEKLVYHDYNRTGTFTVMLTVTNERGDTASQRSTIAITPLSVIVPAKKIGDSANYDVTGGALAANNDTYLYTYPGPVTVQVNMLTFQFTGEQSIWVAGEAAQVEDGFRNPHRALHTVTKEILDPISGKAYTTAGEFNIQGSLDYTEDAYADPATGGIFNSTSRAHTSLSLIGLSFATRNSTDTLHSYPSVAGMAGQFRPEDIYRGHRFEQGDPTTLSGNLTAGGVRYDWTTSGVDYTGGQPSIGLHVTGDQEALRRSGITEFRLDLYLSSAVSLPTKTSLHVAGLNGDTFYVTDHEAELTHFSPGTDAIDTTPQSFNADPLPASDFSSPFYRVPANGTGPTSLRFGPSDALDAASSDSGLTQYLDQNPAAYAVRGKYYEPALPLESSNWNLTFSYPGATSGYYINVTREQLPQLKYLEHGNFIASPGVNTSQSELARMLTMAAVQARFQSDTETAGTFFSGGTLQFSGGTTLSLSADAVYPAINLAALSASAQTARYAAILQKGAYTSALSMDTGQMMYFWTHTTV